MLMVGSDRMHWRSVSAPMRTARMIRNVHYRLVQLINRFHEDWGEVGTKSSQQTIMTDITGVSSQVLLMNHCGEISVRMPVVYEGKGKSPI